MLLNDALRDGFSLVAGLALVGCGPSHAFVSPTVEQGPPPYIGPEAPEGSASPGMPRVGPTGPIVPQPLTFFRTQDSNEWVTRSFKVQSTPARVIAVYAGPAAPTRVAAPRVDLNGFPGGDPVVDMKVDLAVRSLQEAADAAKGGDFVAVFPGHYKGFTLGDKADASDGHFIHFKALGAPGDVVIDGPSPADSHWMIVLQGAHHVIVQGFNLAGVNTPGTMSPVGPNAGILIDGDFVHTTRLAHHLAIVGNYSHDHQKWGIHSVDSHTVLVQDNLFANSVIEHSAYFSDGSDNYVIRRNVFFGSAASGLQINVDPLASLEKLVRHPAMSAQPMQGTRGWALDVLKSATEKFGANAFPDGRGFNFIIEGNVMNRNGRVGGAGINLAGVRESLVQNNLIYGNLSTGIAEWDNGNPFDASQVKPGPQVPSDISGADALPIFGCFNNVVRNNTVLTSTRGRPALLVGNGSWGTRARNNIFINDEFPSVEFAPTGIWRFDGSSNVIDRVNYDGSAAALKSLAFSLPDGPTSMVGVTRRLLAPSFVQPTDEPWVILDATWWRLNPRRPDFHPRTNTATLAGRADPRDLPKIDLEGRRRHKADIGAFSASQ